MLVDESLSVVIGDMFCPKLFSNDEVDCRRDQRGLLSNSL